MKKLFICLMVVVMAICFVPVTALAGQDVEVENVSKSKEATNLDSEFNSEIVLSLPSAEQQLVSDVVFVLDKSTSAEIEDEALAMLTNLEKQIHETGAKIKVGVVIFNKAANEAIGLTELNAENFAEIQAAVKMKISGGTNLHAGIMAGKAMLDRDASVEAARKHMIVVSDGITYMFNQEPTAVAWSWKGDSVMEFAGPDNWQSKYGSDAAPENWTVWLETVRQNVAADGSRFDYPYGGEKKEATAPENFRNHAMSVDKALYLSYGAYNEAVQSGYNCYAMGAETGTSYGWGPDFMNYLAKGKRISFEEIQNGICYAISSGSYVTDTMGEDSFAGKSYNFDFVNDIEKINVTVGNQTLSKEQTGNNSYGFGKKEGGSYRFEVIYYPQGAGGGQNAESIVWKINENVSNFQRVQLRYWVYLTNPQTDAGAYGYYDKDGKQGFEGLCTNNSATLHPVDSQGVSAQPEEFGKPTVSYTVTKALPPKSPVEIKGVPNTGDMGGLVEILGIMFITVSAATTLWVKKFRRQRL